MAIVNESSLGQMGAVLSVLAGKGNLILNLQLINVSAQAQAALSQGTAALLSWWANVGSRYPLQPWRS